VIALNAAASAGVPVPQAFEWSDDPAILGAPFFLAERAPGTPPEAWGNNAAGDAGWRRSMGHDFVDAIAALHRFDWEAAVPPAWSAGLDIHASAARQIDLCEANYRRWALVAHPMMHRAFGWLRKRLPVAPRISLVHGDYRIGNFLEQGGGSRRSSIGNWCIWATRSKISAGRCYRNSKRDRPCLRADRRDKLPAYRYQDKAGLAVAPAALAFYKVLALVKLALTHMAAARCFEDGRFTDMRMPAMATQIAPVSPDRENHRGCINEPDVFPPHRRHGRDLAVRGYPKHAWRVCTRAGFWRDLHAGDDQAPRQLVKYATWRSTGECCGIGSGPRAAGIRPSRRSPPCGQRRAYPAHGGRPGVPGRPPRRPRSRPSSRWLDAEAPRLAPTVAHAAEDAVNAYLLRQSRTELAATARPMFDAISRGAEEHEDR